MIVSTNMGEQPQLVNLYQFINAFLFEHSPHCDPVFCVCIFVDRLWVFRMWWEFKYIEKAHLNIFRNFAFLSGWDWPLYVVWVIVPWTSPKLSILLSEEIFFRLWAEWSYQCWLPKVFAEDKMCFIHVPEAVKKHWWQALLSPRHPNCNSLPRNLKSGAQRERNLFFEIHAVHLLQRDNGRLWGADGSYRCGWTEEGRKGEMMI